jgi:hypothetical protein
VHWDNYLRQRVGTPTAPFDEAAVVDRANRLFDYATKTSACGQPLIGINELFGATLATPWSPSYTQYRANVLTYLRTLASRGARPFLAVPSRPYTSGEAAEWWRQAAQVADIVPEVYFNARLLHRLGPIRGSRFIREAFRRRIVDYTSIGVPTSRLGLFLGFQTRRGSGGREGLEPEQAWFRTVKWQALAAREIVAELKIKSIWSWGWHFFSTSPDSLDPDKEAAACVYLWARKTSLCKGPALAGRGFNASLTEGQIRLGRGVQCVVGGTAIRTRSIKDLAKLTGDWDLAFTALLARATMMDRAKLTSRAIAAAEQTVVGVAFGGRRAAYLAALRRAKATPSVARGVLADELLRAQIEPTLTARRPTSADISEYYVTYADVLTRRVRAKPAADWLGGKQEGIALASNAPGQVFRLPTGRSRKVRTLNRTYSARALTNAVPLRTLPLAAARPAISAALLELARSDAFDRWLLAAEQRRLGNTTCWRDLLPDRGVVDLTEGLEFLLL